MRNVFIWIACFRIMAVPSLLITSITFITYILSNEPEFLVVCLWTKIITCGVLLLFVHFFRSSELIFFNNLGYPTSTLYTRMAVIDMTVALVPFSIAMYLL